MKVLVINAGSSSLKFQLIETDSEKVVAKGICERIGVKGSNIKFNGRKEIRVESPMPTHKEAIELLLKTLTDADCGVISDMKEIGAVGHRVLHSGGDYNDSVLITPETLKVIKSNIELGPLHMPPNIMGIEACQKVLPDAPMVAVFDNTFHSTMPDYAYMYAIPYEDYKQYKVRKYGFHGTSHKFVASVAHQLLGKTESKIVICHLGGGASVSAVKDGNCIDTSMGFTPLEGLLMGTRSGDIDPAVLEFLMAKKKMNIHEVTEYLNKKSGVEGISGVSSDFRDLEKAYAEGNDRARLAIEMFSYRVKKYIGAYAAALGGLDLIAFTGGIGEHTAIVRRQVVQGLEFMGVKLDVEASDHPADGNTLISAADSKVKVYIIPTNEELVIARETLRLK